MSKQRGPQFTKQIPKFLQQYSHILTKKRGGGEGNEYDDPGPAHSHAIPVPQLDGDDEEDNRMEAELLKQAMNENKNIMTIEVEPVKKTTEEHEEKEEDSFKNGRILFRRRKISSLVNEDYVEPSDDLKSAGESSRNDDAFKNPQTLKKSKHNSEGQLRKANKALLSFNEDD